LGSHIHWFIGIPLINWKNFSQLGMRTEKSRRSDGTSDILKKRLLNSSQMRSMTLSKSFCKQLDSNLTAFICTVEELECFWYTTNKEVVRSDFLTLLKVVTSLGSFFFSPKFLKLVGLKSLFVFWVFFFFFLVFFVFFVFSEPHLRHMEFPSLGVKSELQLPVYTTATATWDLSHICNLHHSSLQRRILNPLILNLMVPSQIRFHCVTMGTRKEIFKRKTF